MPRSLFFLSLIFLIGETTPTPANPFEQVVARIGDRQITEWDLEYTRDRSNGQGDREAWMRTIARDRLGALKAEEAGLPESSPELKWRLWSLENSVGAEAYLANLTKDVSVEESEVRDYYDNNRERFLKQPSFSFQYIFCDTTELKSKADIERFRDQLEIARKKLVDSASPDSSISLEKFSEVAGNCECAGEPKVQSAGPFQLDEPIQDVIKQAALSLEPGQFSPVISTKYGFQIIRLEDRTEASVIMEYEDIKDRIRQFLEGPLKQAKIQNYLEDLKTQTDRYKIHPIQLEHQLPGAHRKKPESPYVVEIGDAKWEPEDFKNFMKTIHRQEWMMSHKIDKASQTTLNRLVIPSLLHLDAQAAGFGEAATEIAKWKNLRDQTLAYYWVMHTANRLASETPQPTTEEYRAYYDQNPGKFTIPERYRVRWILAPLSSATDTERSPADIEFEYRDLEAAMAQLHSEVLGETTPTAVLEKWREEIPGLEEKTDWLYRGGQLSKETWEKIGLDTRGWLEGTYRTQEGVILVEILDSQESFKKPFSTDQVAITNPVKLERKARIVRKTWENLEEEAWKELVRVGN